jgi:hypothetical protein
MIEESCLGYKISVFSKATRLALGPVQPKIQWVKRKVKQSCNRPGVAQRVSGGLGSQIFMTFST